MLGLYIYTLIIGHNREGRTEGRTDGRKDAIP